VNYLEERTVAIIRAGDAPRFAVEGAELTGLASPSRGSTEISVWRGHIGAGASVPPHTLSKEEIFVALSGSALVSLGEERFSIAAGDALIVPPHTPFSLAIPHDAPFEAVIAMPSGGLATMVGGDGTAFPPPWSV
jgi:mannose-6-phosphate isomerase-like protein (cupin superfamily)